MKVVKPMKMPVLHRVVEVARRPYFHLAAMLGFPLDSPRALLDEMSFWTGTQAELGEKGALDEGFAKAFGELLAAGSFFAPQGKAVTASYVRARVGGIDKRLSIVGNRYWKDGVPTAPEPFVSMPVDWAHAFGGASYDRNPYGKGAEAISVDGKMVQPLPNIEPYGSILRSPSDKPDPAGFLPIDVTFIQRRKRAGTYDKRWLEENFPGMAADMNPNFFNTGSEDQWMAGYFRGDEEILIEHMHPERPRIESRLPGLCGRAFVTHKTAEGERFVEMTLRCDTVWLFPKALIGVVIFHGSLPIHTDDAADILHLVCACEEPSAPRPPDHYHAAMLRRMDKDKGALAGLSDSDLMPARESGVAANIALDDMDMGRWVKMEHLAAQNARRGQERYFEKKKQELLAEGIDPKEAGLPDLPPPEEMPPMDDMDALAAFMEKQGARADEQLEALEQKAEEAKERARGMYAEMGQDYDETMAKALKEGGGPPKFSAKKHLAMLHGMAEEARQEGDPNEELETLLAMPGYEAQIMNQEEQLMGLYRSIAHLQPAALAMEPEASEQTRLLIQMAREQNEPLVGRNFTGVDLSGVDLSGLDLSGVLMESANLAGANLSNAKLVGAVLAKANMQGADCSRADLRGANVGAANLKGANFSGANLGEAVLSRSELSGACFEKADLSGADWLEVKPGRVNLSGARLGICSFLKTEFIGANFSGADLTEATFLECALDEADFSGALLVKTTFVTCKGLGVSFRGARFNQGVIAHGSAFPKGDFRNAEMSKANLRGTYLKGALFSGTRLDGADLSECNASNTNFDRAYLVGGMMIRTDLTDASLQGANLMDVLASKAILLGANFLGANLYRADLSRVIGNTKTSFAEAEVGHVRFLPKADAPRGGT